MLVSADAGQLIDSSVGARVDTVVGVAPAWRTGSTYGVRVHKEWKRDISLRCKACARQRRTKQSRVPAGPRSLMGVKIGRRPGWRWRSRPTPAAVRVRLHHLIRR
jgi:hypothetical protein